MWIMWWNLDGAGENCKGFSMIAFPLPSCTHINQRDKDWRETKT